MKCDVCLEPNKTLYGVTTCGKRELWCANCKAYELGTDKPEPTINDIKREIEESV